MIVQGPDGTLWSALTGVAFAGPKKGKRLERLPSLTTDWGYWRMLHPESTAYNLFDGKKYKVTDLPVGLSQEAKISRGRSIRACRKTSRCSEWRPAPAKPIHSIWTSSGPASPTTSRASPLPSSGMAQPARLRRSSRRSAVDRSRFMPTRALQKPPPSRTRKPARGGPLPAAPWTVRSGEKN